MLILNSSWRVFWNTPRPRRGFIDVVHAHEKRGGGANFRNKIIYHSTRGIWW